MDFNSTETLAVNPTAVKNPSARRPSFVIRPERGLVALELPELWQFRDLMFALAARDIKLRYKQTALGVVWVVLQPLMTAGILSFVFGTVAHMKSGSIPYFVFSYAGLMGWNLFSAVLTKAGGSLVGNANLISKVYFPRMLLPFSSIPSSLVDFAIAVGMLIVLLFLYHLPLQWGLLALPVWIALLLVFATGFGLVATSLMVSYRDVGYVLPVALQILFYATPIIYPIANVPQKLQFWFNLNPLSEVFEAIRWSVFGSGAVDWVRMGYAIAGAVVTLFIGIYSFKHMEKKFADVI